MFQSGQPRQGAHPRRRHPGHRARRIFLPGDDRPSPPLSLRRPAKKVLSWAAATAAAREITRHPSVEHLKIAEIDGMVIEMSKNTFPACPADSTTHASMYTLPMASSGRRRRGGDLRRHHRRPSDPVGPAAVLFERVFREDPPRAQARRRGVHPGGGIWLHAELIKDVLEMCKDIFKGDRCSTGTPPSRRTLQARSDWPCAASRTRRARRRSLPRPREPPEARVRHLFRSESRARARRFAFLRVASRRFRVCHSFLNAQTLGPLVR